MENDMSGLNQAFRKQLRLGRPQWVIPRNRPSGAWLHSQITPGASAYGI